MKPNYRNRTGALYWSWTDSKTHIKLISIVDRHIQRVQEERGPDSDHCILNYCNEYGKSFFVLMWDANQPMLKEICTGTWDKWPKQITNDTEADIKQLWENSSDSGEG